MQYRYVLIQQGALMFALPMGEIEAVEFDTRIPDHVDLGGDIH